MSQEVNLRRFLMDAKSRAEEVLSQTHVGADVKAVIRDLLQVGTNLTDLMDQATGQSADSRMLKKKLEQVKYDSRSAETKFVNAKNAVLQLATEIELISRETKAMRSRQVLATDPNAASLVKMEASIANIVKAVVQLSSI